jgi:uncharacterized membrane protein
MRRPTAVVAAIGVAIAGYLTVVHYAGAEPACFIAHGCTVVQQSAYSTLAGIPVAVLGLGAYATVLVTVVRDSEATRTLAAAVALIGAGFSAWLTYVEVARLHAICAWCVASAVCMAALAGLSVIRFTRAGTDSADRPAGAGSARPSRPARARRAA